LRRTNGTGRANAPELEPACHLRSQHPKPDRIFAFDRPLADEEPSIRICADIPVGTPGVSVRRIIRGVRIDPARTSERDFRQMDFRHVDEPVHRAFCAAELAEDFSGKSD
jgi:hypothetical protein